MADDPLTVALEEIRERFKTGERFADGSWKAQIRYARASANDVPRLLAAVEAVLKLHHPVNNGGWLECEACGPNNDDSGIYAVPGEGEDFWPCETYRAITRELTGKGGTDEG